MTTTAALRAMHFYPPAKALVLHLRSGTKVELVRQADNEFDPNAIQVWVSPKALPEDQREAFAIALAGWGKDLEEFDSAPQWMLGFVGKEWAQGIAPLMDKVGAKVSAKFAVSGDGKPQVEIEVD